MLSQSIAFEPQRDADIFAQVPTLPGVFLLRSHDAEAEPYVSKAANLRRRIARLLGPAELQGISKRLNLRERCATIEFTATGSDFENLLLLYRTLRKVFPESYSKRLRLNLAPFIRIHWENAYPRAYVTRKLTAAKKASGSQSVYFGPFRSRAAADKFLNDSLDLFKSRRCTFELDPDPAFPGCVYSEMKMCLAPCFKGCSDAQYMAEMRCVQEFFESYGESLLGELEEQRELASAGLEFETAAVLHIRIEKVKSVVRGGDEIIRRIDHLDAVILQPSVAADELSLFLYTRGQFAGPSGFSMLGMLPAVTNERSGNTSLYAQPILVQPVPEEPDSILGSKESRTNAEMRLSAALELFHLDKKTSNTAQMEQLALLKRWYYRGSRQGEIFFRNADGKWPLRRILNGASRVFVGDKPSAVSHQP